MRGICGTQGTVAGIFNRSLILTRVSAQPARRFDYYGYLSVAARMRGIQTDYRAPTIEGITGNRNGQIMHLSRALAAAAAACVLAATMPQLAQAREIVGFSGPYSSGTVVVKTTERALYYVLGNGKAVRYPVGVGRLGKQ